MNALTAVSPLDVSFCIVGYPLTRHLQLKIYTHTRVHTVTRDTRYATIVPGNWLAHSYFRLTLPTHSRLLRAASSFNISDHKFWLQLYPGVHYGSKVSNFSKIIRWNYVIFDTRMGKINKQINHCKIYDARTYPISIRPIHPIYFKKTFSYLRSSNDSINVYSRSFF